MKAGIAKIPFVGAACRAAGFIFVDNSTPKAAARSVLEAERCLRNGASVVVFPEGSRTYDGNDPFQERAYQMALDQHLPIIPITLNGPFDVLPIGSLNVHRHRMEMVIHPAVSTENIDTSHKGMQAFADQTQEIIASALWKNINNLGYYFQLFKMPRFATFRLNPKLSPNMEPASAAKDPVNSHPDKRGC